MKKQKCLRQSGIAPAAFSASQFSECFYIRLIAVGFLILFRGALCRAL
jgi:hypothetical protein